MDYGGEETTNNEVNTLMHRWMDYGDGGETTDSQVNTLMYG